MRFEKMAHFGSESSSKQDCPLIDLGSRDTLSIVKGEGERIELEGVISDLVRGIPVTTNWLSRTSEHLVYSYI